MSDKLSQEGSQECESGALSWEDAADIVNESTVNETYDLGHSFMIRLEHPRHGRCILVHSSQGSSGLIHI